MILSGYGTLVPASIRCAWPGAVECPGGWLGPPAVPASTGSQWFDVVAYDYGFWITDTVSGQNDTGTWDLYEGWTAHINATSYPPNPSVGGVGEHGIGIYSNSLGTIFDMGAPIGSWDQSSFVVPSVQESGDQVYCTVFCGPGHGSMSLAVISILPAPVVPTATISARPLSGSAPLTVDFSGLGSGGTSPYTYAWDFGDGTTSTLQTPTHVYAVVGTYTASLVVTDASGATAMSSVVVSVNPPPPLSASASAFPSSGAVPLLVAFDVFGIGGTPPYTYAWTFGDGSTGTGPSPRHTYNVTGSYVAQVLVTDATGASASASAYVSVVPPPPLSVSASASATSGTAWLHENFTATASGGTSPYNVTWDFGDGAVGYGFDVSHVYRSAGTYIPQVTVRDAAGDTGTAVTSTISVTGGLGCPLAIRIGASPTSGSTPLLVTLTASLSGGTGGYSVAWDFGDGGTGTGTQSAHWYTTGGTFLVTAWVRDSSGHVVSATTNVSASALTLKVLLDRAVAEAPQSVRATASISGGSGGYSMVRWNWGDGSTVQGCTDPTCEVAVHNYTSPPPSGTTYLVVANVTDGANEQASDHASIVVYPHLTGVLVNRTSSQVPPFHVNLTLELSGGTGVYPGPFLWSFGDGSSALTGENATASYARPGVYLVRVDAQDSLGVAINVTGSISLATHVSPGPSTGGGTDVRASVPWKGVGSSRTTGLALIGLMALGALFLLLTGPRRRKRTAAALASSQPATAAAGAGVTPPSPGPTSGGPSQGASGDEERRPGPPAAAERAEGAS